jgi:periplasmic divalent cation tolerance protein
MTDKIIVLTTWPDSSGAARFANELVQERLAACVNILPEMVSIYQWQGKMEQGKEHQLIIKTHARLYPQVASLISRRHPYELPEILSIPVVDGLPRYLRWIDEATHAE